MAKALLIAEKPSMCNDIKNAINQYGFKDEIDFATFAGHVVRQKEPHEYKEEWKKWNVSSLPIIPQKITFIRDENKKDLFDNLNKKIKMGNYDYLICATDAAREGNLIFAAFYEAINCKLPVKRFFNNSLTPKSIKESMDNLLEWDTGRMKRLTDSAYLRSYFDSLSGWNFTRAYTLAKCSTSAINIGRVMTPVIGIVVDRELAIRNFKPETYYEILGFFKKDDEIFPANALNEDNRILSFKTKKEADDFIKSIQNEKAIVESVTKTRSKQLAPELFSLATLQNAANKEFGYSLQQTLDITQTLYENKWVSYPRTESSHLTTSVSKELSNLLTICHSHPIYGKFVDIIDDKHVKMVQSNKKYVDDSKVEDHYALIPTEIVPDYNKMSVEQKNIYNLIVRQFVAIFYDPLVVDKSEVIIDIKNNKFKAKGSILIDKGFTVLFNSTINDITLPEVREKEILAVDKYELLNKKTTPPKRFTEGTLNEAMMNANRFIEDEHEKEIIKEASGIGKPSTRAKIIEKCLDKNFLERKRNVIYPTDYAIAVINDLRSEDITSVSLTAKWEEKLKQVEDGQLSYNNFYNEMIEYITKETLKLTNFSGGNVVDKNSLGVCPICGRPVISSEKYYRCANYKGSIDEGNPCGFIIGKDFFGVKINESNAKLLIEGKPTKELTFTSQSGEKYKGQLIYDKTDMKIKRIRNSSDTSTANNEAKVQVKTGEKCPNCGHDMVLKKGKFGNFEACSNYPSCKYIKPKGNKKTIEKTGEKCPQCGHDMVFRNGQFGRFEACSNYPACKYIKKKN